VFPSGSRKAAKRQTPVSHVSAMNSTPLASSSVRASATSSTRTANPASFDPLLPRSRLAQEHRVPSGRERDIPRRDRDEVHLLDAHNPMKPPRPRALPLWITSLGPPLFRKRSGPTATGPASGWASTGLVAVKGPRAPSREALETPGGARSRSIRSGSPSRHRQNLAGALRQPASAPSPPAGRQRSPQRDRPDPP
jgi:hypothetical protein